MCYILLDKYAVDSPYYPSWFCVFVVAFRDSQKRFLEVFHPSLSLEPTSKFFSSAAEAGDRLFLTALAWFFYFDTTLACLLSSAESWLWSAKVLPNLVSLGGISCDHCCHCGCGRQTLLVLQSLAKLFIAFLFLPSLCFRLVPQPWMLWVLSLCIGQQSQHRMEPSNSLSLSWVSMSMGEQQLYS